MNNVFSVLAIDDDPSQIELLGLYCGSMEYPRVEFRAASDAASAFKILNSSFVDLVFTDFRLPDVDGLEVLSRVKALNPEIRVVVMTAYQDARQAVEILKGGADDYLIKPTKEQDIKRLLLLMYEKLTRERETADIRREFEETFDDSAMVLKSREMLEVMHTAATAAGSDATVLITGESGTGKELVARLIHAKSRRGGKAFVTVNISALSESLAESELFGHKKGAFTGAVEDRKGRFEEADGGTIFIDEIGDISPGLQVKLLRVLQFGEVQRVGENSTRKLDVRIVAATHRDLNEMVRARQFRQDLFYRINVIHIRIPPLRDRKTDIPPLVEHFIGNFAAEQGKNIRGISREALDAVMRRSFPGNVRELENLVERAVVFAREDQIRLRDIPPPGDEGTESPCGDGVTYDERMRSFEAALLEQALEAAEGNQSRAAGALGMTERHLRSRITRLGVRNRWKIGA